MAFWGILKDILGVLANVSIIILTFKSLQALNIYIKKNEQTK
jgi:hypothetical protein